MGARLTNWANADGRTTRRMRPALVSALTATNLIHSCVIQARNQEVDEDDAPVYDDYGQPVMGDYAPTLSPPVTATGQRTPCFAWQPLPGGRDGEQATDDSAYVAHRWHFLLPVGTAVAEDDQIADVRDEDDVVIVAGPLNVKEVRPRRGHTLARCDLAATGLGAA
jgi:hypothetical protein